MESKSSIQPLTRPLPKDFSGVIEEAICFIRAERLSNSYFWGNYLPCLINFRGLAGNYALFLRKFAA